MALEVIIQASCCTHKEFKGVNGTENLVANIERAFNNFSAALQEGRNKRNSSRDFAPLEVQVL
jgi:hypothetical protein